MYKISEIAKIANISTRTLRYYDKINLLKPSKNSVNSYRFYTKDDLDKLYQILLYKNLGLELNEISNIVNNEFFDIETSLKASLEKYKSKKIIIENYIENIEKSLENLRSEGSMNNIESFEIFKQKLIKENDVKYGEELEQKYDIKKVMYSKNKVKNMTEDEYNSITDLFNEIQDMLEKYVSQSEFDEEIARCIYEKHKSWLCFYWGTYSKEAHMGVADLYIADERFKKAYDKNIIGCADYLRKCIYFCCEDLIDNK